MFRVPSASPSGILTFCLAACSLDEYPLPAVPTGSGAGGCSEDRECDDGIDCTRDRCVAGPDTCENVADDQLCELPERCDPAAGCSLLSCRTNGDCDDMLACTRNFCDEATGTCGVADETSDGDGDGFFAVECGGDDCNDTNPEIRPGKPDEPDADGIDSNCDGMDGEADRAVYVAPGGDDAAAGTAQDPVASVARGLARAGELGFPVVVLAEGEYRARVVVAAPMVIEGGFTPDPVAWTRAPGARSVIAGDGIGVSVEEVDGVVALRALVIESGPAPSLGASAYGVRALRSTGLVLAEVEVVAATGADGAAGAAGTRGPSGSSASDGADGIRPCSEDAAGAPGADGRCTEGGSGGNGGDGNCGDDYDWENGYGASGREGGGGAVGGDSGVPGEDGEPGEAGANGENAPQVESWGSVANDLWQPHGGAVGSEGQAGAGGGGGGGGEGSYWWKKDVYSSGGGGGGGGEGGCGGGGGAGGGGGGWSFALFLVQSSASLRQVHLTAGDGGAGGRGGDGGAEGSGGAGGSGGDGPSQWTTSGASGGDGGDGGRGGAGSGGPGGWSCAVYRDDGSDIVGLEEERVTLGAGGQGGPGGAVAGLAGGAGKSQTTCSSADAL